VQRCTAEYIKVIGAAGIELDVQQVVHDERPMIRLLRRAHSSPYFRPISKAHVKKLARRSAGYDIVFFNQVNLAGSLNERELYMNGSPCRILLSHGAEIVDLLHISRLRADLPLSGRLWPSTAMALGSVLRDEAHARKHIDAVVTLSQFDAEFEEWLGSKNVTWLPRIIDPAPLDWSPSRGKFGFVGTLDHAPNLEGLVLILDATRAASKASMRIRVIGGPQSIGRWLRDRYPNVDYLGPMDDTAMEAEAATWQAFLHPIFCQARGCSTKLAMALGWQIPIITTPFGRRGYVWQSGCLIEAETPRTFVDHMVLLDGDETRLSQTREAATEVARTSPTLEGIASQFVTFLGGLGTRDGST
jgi:hypothetical protein